MANFFTSDWHLYHENVIKYSNRPFANAAEMNEAIIANTNKIVTKRDNLYILGDLFFTSEYETFASDLKRVNGNIYVVPGNHDYKFRRHGRDLVHAGIIRQLMPDLCEIRIDRMNIVLSHFPLLSWNKAHHGSVMLHGHSHGTTMYPFAARIKDVGIDCHPEFRPFSWEDEILPEMLKIEKNDPGRDR